MPPYIDISRLLRYDTPTWPGSPGLTTSLHLAIERGDPANATLLSMDAHAGTHVDAPLHFVANGATLEELGLDPFVGEAYVAAVGDVDVIDAATLENLALPPGIRRLLLRTRNSADRRFKTAPFCGDYAALDAGAACWVVDHALELIGIDYLSVQRFDDTPETHEILLGGGVAILEGIDLAGVEAGAYTLVCLPLRLADAEAAPARAILMPRGT